MITDRLQTTFDRLLSVLVYSLTAVALLPAAAGEIHDAIYEHDLNRVKELLTAQPDLIRDVVAKALEERRTAAKGKAKR
jgi:2-phosphoglycerate kinase